VLPETRIIELEQNIKRLKAEMVTASDHKYDRIASALVQDEAELEKLKKKIKQPNK